MTSVSESHAETRASVRSVQVPLGDRAYEVLIGPGLLAKAGELIAARLGAPRCGIVTDENVARFHLPALEAVLKRANLHAGSIVLKPGESTKSFRELAPLSERLLELGLERGDLVVAFGGGVMGDLAGFAAAILRRGVRFVQIPTTLLAQVDSSVGGKTGIDTPQGKNLIGAFHQPSLVIADTDTLRTLPDREMRAGYAEVAKYGLLGDAVFFAWLEQSWRSVFAFEEAALTRAIETSVKAKAGIVGRDETEQDERALLNLGHTFGHAFEAWCGYSDRLLHGEAIAIGMCNRVPLLGGARALRAGCGQARCRPFRGRRVTDSHRRHSRCEAGRGGAHAPHVPGQEGTPRQAHVHSRARHRRGLRHQRCRRRARARVPHRRNRGRQALT